MGYELFLALRYLRSRRPRGLVRVTALAAIVGIAVGVGAFIVALGLANGFRDEMRDKILRGTAHLTLMRSDGQPISNYRDVLARIRKVDGVMNASATTYDGAMLTGPRGSAYAVLRGVDGESEQARREVARTMIEGRFDLLFEPPKGETSEPVLPHIVLGSDLATRTGLAVGGVGEILSASASIATNTPIYRHVRVAGIFRSGLFEYDSTWVYLSLDRAAAFAGTNDTASAISVSVSDIYDVKPIAANVVAAIGKDYTAVDWQEANRPLFTALALERRMSLFIIALIILMAALNITTTLVLLVVERRSDIAILGAMGATPRSIMSIFIAEGAIIGTLGALIGIVLGTVTCLVGNHYKLVSLPPDVYSINNVPFNSSVPDILLSALVAISLTLLATIYPARAAARVRPVEVLRDAN
jgi:lipoprotein-releasing system permease protein